MSQPQKVTILYTQLFKSYRYLQLINLNAENTVHVYNIHMHVSIQIKGFMLQWSIILHCKSCQQSQLRYIGNIKLHNKILVTNGLTPNK